MSNVALFEHTFINISLYNSEDNYFSPKKNLDLWTVLL